MLLKSDLFLDTSYSVFCLRWTLMYWIMDGVGLIAWARVAPPRWLAVLGLTEILFGISVSFLRGTIGRAIPSADASVFLVFVVLVVSQQLALRAYRNHWEQVWQKLGHREIWSGRTLISMLVGLVLAAVYLSGRRVPSDLEGIAWSMMTAIFLASVIRPSGFGYHSVGGLRAFAKASGLFAFGVGAILMTMRWF